MAEPIVERPSLRQAKQRTAHAAIRLSQLMAAAAELRSKNAGAHLKVLVDREQFESRSANIQPTFDFSELSGLGEREHLEHLCSEVVHHLRVALDYLAYQVCWLDSGQRQDFTQFPICDSAMKWKKEKKDRLPGATIEHRDAIGKLQPVNGCDWTLQLRELSNPDKHRFISDIARNHSGVISFDAALYSPAPDDPSKLVARFPAETSITFSDGEDVIEVLTDLASHVARTLEAFQGWFGETDVLNVHLPES